jgi:CCR4-NOT transcriptional regulation complex NOT5 subunit
MSSPTGTGWLDQEYPALGSTMPKQTKMAISAAPATTPPPAPPPTSTPPPQPATPRSPLTATEQYELFGIDTPESVFHTDFSRQDFAQAVAAAIQTIPDPPYDVRDVTETSDLPPGFPHTPNLKLCQPASLKKLDLQALFYIFFFSPDTPQQYFVAQELKKRDWQFHMRYHTWFKRVADPTEKKDTYEVARFDYFDTSAAEGWCVRPRQGFRMEYEHLAD